MPRLLAEPLSSFQVRCYRGVAQLDALPSCPPRHVRGQACGFLGDIPAGPGSLPRHTTSFLPDLDPGRLIRLRHPTSFSEAENAADRAQLLQAEVEAAKDAADTAEEEAEAAEHAELLVVGLATIFAGLAWFTTYKTWQLYQRWIAMKRRKALCVGAARAAAAASQGR
ncbi:PDS [Symbiodinium natans]|uniref:PDS protein n=1 Tax=Symbiodinium natans TaxID=878477 RepID=A0A812RCR5_9DINO|nr:PDS [Symbiodinium natans]